MQGGTIKNILKKQASTRRVPGKLGGTVRGRAGGYHPLLVWQQILFPKSTDFH